MCRTSGESGDRLAGDFAAAAWQDNHDRPIAQAVGYYLMPLRDE